MQMDENMGDIAAPPLYHEEILKCVSSHRESARILTGAEPDLS